jgi:hypothetical protein
VIDVLDREIQLVLVPFGVAAELTAAISQHAQELDIVLLEERQHTVIEQIGRRDWRLAVVGLGKAYLGIGVDEGPPKREAEVKLALRNRDRLIELPLSQDMLGRLAIEAHFANLSISEMTAKLIAAAIEIDLFEKPRDGKCPRT